MNSLRGPLAFIGFAAAAATCLSAQDRSYGRSVVVTQYGIVATSYVQAAQAGHRQQVVFDDFAIGHDDKDVGLSVIDLNDVKGVSRPEAAGGDGG